MTAGRAGRRASRVGAGAILGCLWSIQAPARGNPGESRPAPIRTLLVTGENNHDWRFTSRLHADTLEGTGRFNVVIVDDPARGLAKDEAWRGVELVVLDYNGRDWGRPAREQFESRVRGGVGVVVVHASNNAFPGWEAYERACGLCWREGSGHGEFHEFDVRFVAREHPITRGLPDLRAHPDELYHRLVNVRSVEHTLLALADSDPRHGGVGEPQPMAIALTLGEGRVFHTPLGHVWEGRREQRRSIQDPAFRSLLARGAQWAARGEVDLPAAWADGLEHNTLQDAERASGWTLLFDGVSPGGFRRAKGEGMPDRGWIVEDGCLRHVAGAGGGDIVTLREYEDFELCLEWRVAPGGNSGIFYLVREDLGGVWDTGLEMQVLDDTSHRDGAEPKTSAGALYGLLACGRDVARPPTPGVFNHARILKRGRRVEHWLNGELVVRADLDSPEFRGLVQGSKFRDLPNFGVGTTGRIALQEHGDDVWYRDIKIRRIEPGAE